MEKGMRIKFTKESSNPDVNFCVEQEKRKDYKVVEVDDRKQEFYIEGCPFPISYDDACYIITYFN